MTAETFINREKEQIKCEKKIDTYDERKKKKKSRGPQPQQQRQETEQGLDEPSGFKSALVAVYMLENRVFTIVFFPFY